LLIKEKLILKKGTIVDSTIFEAPSSTKNAEHKRDADAHQTKKGNVWHFGYKAHIGVDSETGIAHTVVTTSANVHDVTQTENLLTGEEEQVYGDSGYQGAQKREKAITRNNKNQKIKYNINRRPSSYKGNSARSIGQIKCREKAKSSVRSKVEHVSGAEVYSTCPALSGDIERVFRGCVYGFVVGNCDVNKLVCGNFCHVQNTVDRNIICS
jgi:IS5 family transposase